MTASAADYLGPLSPASPCGDDLSFSPEFDAIQEARRFDDPTLEQGEWVADLKEADWSAVVERCGTQLRTQSKTLRVTPVMEANVSNHVWTLEEIAKLAD